MAKLERRDFLKLVGAGSVGVGAGFMLAQSIKHPLEHLIPYPIPPEEFSPGVATWYNSVCSMCPAGCGISVRTREGRPKIIQGNPSHPVSQGRLCGLGQSGVHVLYNPDRLTTPLLRTGDRGAGAFVPTTWDEGLAKIAERLRTLRENDRGNRICFLSEGVRGHLAMVFERFMEQLGSQRLWHFDFAHPRTLYEANQRLFGEQHLPYYDLKNARYLLSFGADFLGHWLSPVHHSLGLAHSRQGRPGVRGKFVQIEPRMSLSGAAADEWIAARPGTEGLLALGLAHRIVSAGHYRGPDRDGWADKLSRYPAERVARETGVDADTIARLADSFAQTQPSLAIGGGAAGNHTNGVDILIAVNVLNYLAGNLGGAGGLVFNPPPAVDSPRRHASYRTMLDLAAEARAGQIEVLIVNKTNPVFALPAAAEFKEALARIPLIVSLSSFMDETTALADLVLPSHTYLESWGDDFPEPGVGFPVGAISQPVVSPLYDTRATGDIILGLSQRVGLGTALPWANMEECLKQGWREIHQRGSQNGDAESFETFWTSVLQAGVWGQDAHRAAPAVNIEPRVIDGIDVEAPRFSAASEEYSFILHPYLSTGLHDGRGANLPWMQELPDPLTSVVYGSWVELNPVTAQQLGVSEGDVVDVQSAHGRISAPVYIYPAIRPDVVAMPIGQGHDEYGRYAQRRGVNPIQILAPEMEPSTGALAWSATRVKLVPTGRRVKLVKTDGASRQLGRNIVRTIKAVSS
ncbi:MAG TPA: molybdopterin-dependent oxidoreductase [Steroidobacter sp.]|uniref:molybdopterin-containing oxidoreductase family protein n=1 Tax=Steroidobacter sp. TaxID=1978227 RepID=UPI002ED8EC1D